MSLPSSNRKPDQPPEREGKESNVSLLGGGSAEKDEEDEADRHTFSPSLSPSSSSSSPPPPLSRLNRKSSFDGYDHQPYFSSLEKLQDALPISPLRKRGQSVSSPSSSISGFQTAALCPSSSSSSSSPSSSSFMPQQSILLSTNSEPFPGIDIFEISDGDPEIRRKKKKIMEAVKDWSSAASTPANLERISSRGSSPPPLASPLPLFLPVPLSPPPPPPPQASSLPPLPVASLCQSSGSWTATAAAAVAITIEPMREVTSENKRMRSISKQISMIRINRRKPPRTNHMPNQEHNGLTPNPGSTANTPTPPLIPAPALEIPFPGVVVFELDDVDPIVREKKRYISRTVFDWAGIDSPSFSRHHSSSSSSSSLSSSSISGKFASVPSTFNLKMLEEGISSCSSTSSPSSSPASSPRISEDD